MPQSYLPYRVRRAAIGIGFALLAVGCARPASNSAAVAAGEPSSVGAVSPYEAPMSLPDLGIMFDEAAEEQPTVDASEAIQIAQKEFENFVSEATSVATAFGLFTDTNYGPVDGEEGPVTPSFVKVPAWIVTFNGLKMEGAGGVPVDPKSPLPRESRPNTELNVVIDATTGEVIEAFTYR